MRDLNGAALVNLFPRGRKSYSGLMRQPQVVCKAIRSDATWVSGLSQREKPCDDLEIRDCQCLDTHLNLIIGFIGTQAEFLLRDLHYLKSPQEPPTLTILILKKTFFI